MKQLRDDQLVDLAFSIANPKSLYLHDPGVGKTPPVVVNQYRRLQEGLRTIWVQPKSLMAKNAKEIQEFTPLTAKDVAIVDGTKAQISRAMNSNAGILLMGPDRFKAMVGELPTAALDVDEFHMCFGGAGSGYSAWGSKPSARVEAFYEYVRRAREMVMMSGTLINGRLDTAYPAIHAVEPNYYPFGYDQFVGAHGICDERGRPFAWKDHARIGQIFGRHGIRRTFEQVYGKQSVIFEIEWLAMTQQQRAIYDEFEDQAYLELEKFIVDGTLPGVATIRARQIMEHPNCFPDLRDPENLPPVDIMKGGSTGKMDAMEIHFDHHNRCGTPVIVFAAFIPAQEQIAALAEKMGRKVALLNGATSQRQRQAIDEGYQAGIYDTIVASAPCAAVGFNWQFCGDVETDHVIMSSLTYMHSDFIQGWRRAMRRQRSSPLRVTTQAYLDSVDLKVMTINKRKARDAHLVDQSQEEINFSSHGGEF